MGKSDDVGDGSPSQRQDRAGTELQHQSEKISEGIPVPINNFAAERAIRPFCILKKNLVLINTIRGAGSSAMLYLISETVKPMALIPMRISNTC